MTTDAATSGTKLDEMIKDLLWKELVMRLCGTGEAEQVVNQFEQAVLAVAGLAGEHLIVTGDAERAIIRFKGGRLFLDRAVEAVEGLVEDILASERE